METLVISELEVGQRLDALLAQRFPAYSRARWQQLIDSGGARVNDGPCKSGQRLKLSDVVTVSMPEEKREGPAPQEIPLDILHDDEHLVVVNKPHGMVVHPAKGHWNGTLTAALAFHFEQLSSVGGPTRPGIVHRLDRDTSGVLVVALDAGTHRALSMQFERRETGKTYAALAAGHPPRDAGEIDLPIRKDLVNTPLQVVDFVHGRPSVTGWRVVERLRSPDRTRFELTPVTGRSHQLRVHLLAIGHPILGDDLYAPPEVRAMAPRLCLHAERLSFVHPGTSSRVEFAAPAPF